MKLRPVVFGLCCMLAGGTLAGGVAYGITVASAGDPSTTFYACLAHGSLSQVGTTAPTCSGKSTLISWNAQGPPGTNGTNGTNGANVVTSPGTPSNPCTTGDTDIDLATDQVYSCVSSTWMDTGSNIKGDTGATGPPGSGAEVLTTPGTSIYTVPTGVTWLEVKVQGAGGGGLGIGAGGGGGGATVTALVPASSTCTVGVGAGGPGSNGGPATDGEESYVSCDAGEAVAGGGAAGTFSNGGAGGVPFFGGAAVGITGLAGQMGGFVCPAPLGGNTGGGTGGGLPNQNGGTGGGGGGDCGVGGGGSGGNGLVEITPAT